MLLDWSFIAKGLLVGISVSVPLGPVGVLSIQRTLSRGWFSGFVSGWGAAVADFLFALMAGFGISIISDFLVAQQFYIRFFGSIFLIFFGIRIIRKTPRQQFGARQQQRNHKIASDFFSVFFITLSNPITILAFSAIFAGLGILDAGVTPINTWGLVFGVLTGALLYWFSLAMLIDIFRNRIKLRILFTISKISGFLIIIMGLVAGVAAFYAS